VTEPAAPEPGTIDWVLSTTRTVRRRLDFERPVSLGTVRACLELALQAPTGGALEGWRWIVVTDADTKVAIRDIYLDSHTVASGGRRPAQVLDSDDRMLDGAWYLAQNLHRVPVLIVACTKGRWSPDLTLPEEAALYGSIYPAIWSLHLALRSRGLASAFTTVHTHRAAAMAELLGIPESATQAGLIPVAHLAGAELRPGHRRPVDQVAYLNRWGVPWEGPDPD
jgi:nitroreductase